MNKLARRVLARYLLGEAIGGDPKLILARCMSKVDEWASWEAELPRIVQEAAAGTENRYSKAVTSYSVIQFSTVSQLTLQKLGAYAMCLGLLQQYSLDSSARRKVEEAAQFLTKKGVRDPRSLKTAIPVYQKMLATYRDWLTTIEEVLREGKLRSTEGNGANVLAAGKFKVVNTGGFDQETMLKVVEVVKRAGHLLEAKGLGKVCYGDILISQQVGRGDLLAFYVVNHDEMFVRADLKGKERKAIHTITHELSHRLQEKFLSSKKRQISLMYGRIKRGRKAEQEEAMAELLGDPSTYPKIGERLKDAIVVEFNERRKLVTLQKEADPTKAMTIELWTYRLHQGRQLRRAVTTGFVTPYASTDADENFAEMVAFYCEDKLPEDQITMLLPIIS